MKKMKYSGIEWIGEIPEDWGISTYRRLLNRRKEYDDQDKQVLSLTTQGVKVKNENYGKMAEDFTGHQIVKQGDLVFTPRDFDATPILSGIAPCDGCISNLYFVLYPHNISETFIPFINYFMWGVKWGGDIWKRLSYGMRFSYNFQQFGALPIAVPPIDTQRRIADFLDDKCGKIDRYIEKQQQIIDKLKEYKQAVITEAVTKGLDPDAPMKDSGIEWIGMIPEHWDVKKLKYATDILRGKFNHRPRNDPDYYDGQYPFIQTGDVARATKCINDFSQTLNQKGYDVSKEFPSGSVVMTIAANVADVSILNFRACFPDSIVGFIPKDVDKLYLFYILKAMRQQLLKNAIISTQLNLNIEIIKEEFIAIPSKREQNEIILYLENTCDKINSAIAKQTRIIEKLTEYKKSLIYEAVTGKKRCDYGKKSI